MIIKSMVAPPLIRYDLHIPLLEYQGVVKHAQGDEGLKWVGTGEGRYRCGEFSTRVGTAAGGLVSFPLRNIYVNGCHLDKMKS